MEVLYVIVSFVVGGTLFFLVSRSISYRKINNLEMEKTLVQEKYNSLVQENEHTENKLNEQHIKSEELIKNLSAAETDKKYLKEKLEKQVEELEQLQKKLTLEFENIASKILKNNTLEFSQQNQKNLGEILNPLKERIHSFEKKVQETYEKELRDTTSLKEELKKLNELNKQISEDASNLTNALRSDSKKQGNWGEIILERVLERSGLIQGEEYVIQESSRSSTGELLRPDVIIKLPDNKQVIIDSKVSLTAYEAFVNTDMPEEKEKYLKQHIDSIKNHVNELSEKNYQNIPDLNSPDFTLLFMPIESSFSAAVKADVEMFNYAWQKNIVIVSPTTLLATLRTVASLWKHEKQTRNAIEIADQSGKLYDKFVALLNDLEKMGNQMDTVRKTYDDAHNKLRSGRGNIIGKVEQLKEMGAKASKQIPEKYLEDANLLTEPEE